MHCIKNAHKQTKTNGNLTKHQEALGETQENDYLSGDTHTQHSTMPPQMETKTTNYA